MCLGRGSAQRTKRNSECQSATRVHFELPKCVVVAADVPSEGGCVGLESVCHLLCLEFGESL